MIFKPEILEKLLKFNVFLLILSFSLFLNLYTEMIYNFSLLNIKSIEDWTQKEINSIDLIYVFTFFCLFITGGMHFIRYSAGAILSATGFLNFFIKERDIKDKIHIDKLHEFSIKNNNMAAFRTCKDRLIEKNEFEKLQILCQSIAILIFVTLIMNDISTLHLLILKIESLNSPLYILAHLVALLLGIFIGAMSIESFSFISYFDKKLIQPFLDEEAEKNKLKKKADNYEF